ncbi:MAG: hypothetical protein H7Y59_04630 [Anaerolineales bacterium]|nr:hypothetical protein [Anaerolineales bacterium]
MSKFRKYLLWLLLIGVPYGIFIVSSLRPPANLPAVIGLISFPAWCFLLKKKKIEYEIVQIAILFSLGTSGVVWASLAIIQSLGK